MAESKRSTGTVKWFSGQKGFGFIAPDDGGEDLFVHQTSIRSDGFRTLSEGETVEFAVDHGEDGRTKAVEVTAVRGSYSSGVGVVVMVDTVAAVMVVVVVVVVGYGRGVRGGRRSGRTDDGYGGGGACYNCGRTGHLARDCYQGSGGGRRGYGGGGGYSAELDLWILNPQQCCLWIPVGTNMMAWLSKGE
uniref:Glycine-rich protein 2 n=1 Tax=Vitis vinifera TaxID=29760 RepID=A5BWB0_VITVI|nr:hypothetical protein VITISV_018906 [Vitis vinifera]